MVQFKDRLSAAMKSASISEHQLAAKLDITYTGVKKLLTGKSKEFNATNNAKAARFLGVSSDWLALGDAPMSREDAWPFPMVDRGRFDALEPEQRGYVQKAMNQALDECETAQTRTGLHVVKQSDDQPADYNRGKRALPGTMNLGDMGTRRAKTKEAKAKPEKSKGGSHAA